MKIYLFAIGGSGARILRSLTMLLAAGVKLPNETEFVPILLDPDQGAGNLTETLQLLERYQYIRNCVATTPSLRSFATDISPLQGQSYQIPLSSIAGNSFKDYIGLNVGMISQSTDLVKGLFSPENLNLDMEVGFKGNPNIGSIALGEFDQSAVYQDFVHDFNSGNEDKRIFIISSIFGGTGASGFPTLLNSLRMEQGNVGQAHIGALSLQPYFSVSNDTESQIDSSTFYTKTRAALSYYLDNIIDNNKIDDFYFLGDLVADMHENVEGGSKQRNDAHFIELAGALSIIDFAHQPPIQTGQSRQSKMYEFGIRDGATPITFKSLGPNTEASLASPLTALYLMWRYTEAFDLRTTNDVWLKTIQSNLAPQFVDEFEGFLRDYIKWLEELQNSSRRSFAPIKLDGTSNELFDCVQNYPVTTNSMAFWKKKNFDLYTHELNTKIKSQGAPQTEGELLKILSDVSYELCCNKIGLPTTN